MAITIGIIILICLALAIAAGAALLYIIYYIVLAAMAVFLFWIILVVLGVQSAMEGNYTMITIVFVVSFIVIFFVRSGGEKNDVNSYIRRSAERERQRIKSVVERRGK